MSTSVQDTEGRELSGKYLTFALSKERYGIEILKVQEIIGVPSITRVPKALPHIKGVINLRGKIIPVIDLRLKFGIEPLEYNERTCIIVVNIMAGEQRVAIGVIVDTVLEVLAFGDTDIEPSPDFGTQLDTSFILGMAKRDEHLNILIDIEKLLSAADNSSIQELAE